MAFPPPPAYPLADQEEATEAPETEGTADEPDTEVDGGKGEKNHLYLPENFPFPKPPKEGDTGKALIEWEYVDDKDGEKCLKIMTVDGVPINSDAEDKEDEEMAAESSDDTAQAPEAVGTPPSTANDVTKMIMSGAGQ